MKMMYQFRWLLGLATITLLFSACSIFPTGGTDGGGIPQTYPIGNFSAALHAELFAPTAMPAGSNNWSCHPSANHPYPVVLVHGTFANAAFSWQALSPMLADVGYCVYALNYGQTAESFGRIFGLAPIEQSAGQLESFINKVLSSTGAAQVDIVGHSQGGMMPRYYLKFLGGAPKVHMLVGLAPSNHGTTASNIGTLALELEQLGFPTLSQLGCSACQEQEYNSSFIQQLNAGGDTLPGVDYVVIISKYDEFITPYTSAFLNGTNVDNITLQNLCSTDYTDHIGILYDPVALEEVMNVLGPDNPSFKPQCSVVLPVVGGTTGG
ncbi:MAG: lipase family protein [Actinobacteria bacterium]|nr:lipase family protein [Actinomycetota bacterium]MCL6104873.1 lipase family protein [Actinomycetota bacterium]